MILRHRASVILKLGSDIALVRHHFPRALALPGGGVRRGELASDAARREVSEELGLDFKGIRHLFDFSYGFHRHHVFYATARGRAWPNWEIAEVVPLKKAKGMKMHGACRLALQKYLQRKDF